MQEQLKKEGAGAPPSLLGVVANGEAGEDDPVSEGMNDDRYPPVFARPNCSNIGVWGVAAFAVVAHEAVGRFVGFVGHG